MRRLVGVDLPGGDAFVAALERCFDAGDAVLPIDQRLPKAATDRLLATLRPSAMLSSQGETPLSDGIPVKDGDALVMPTSGTSGTPKGVVLTHSALLASALATSARLGVDSATDQWLCCLPLSHVGGMSVITRALATKTRLEVHPGFDAAAVTAAIRDGVNLISLVATALFRLDAVTVSALRYVVLGGSVPPEELPENVVATYGLTETGSGVIYDGVPLGGVDVEVADDGEISLRGAMLLRAYRDGTDPKDARGFLRTGDLGTIDQQGRLVVYGRREDVIISGGENIWPVPVEQLLARHPGVTEVALVGVRDPEWQQLAVACIVPRAGTTIGLEELRDLVREELGPFHAPRAVEFFDELPRTSIGKIKRGELIEAIERRRATR